MEAVVHCCAAASSICRTLPSAMGAHSLASASGAWLTRKEVSDTLPGRSFVLFCFAWLTRRNDNVGRELDRGENALGAVMQPSSRELVQYAECRKTDHHSACSAHLPGAETG
eukprot:4162839-Pleurochrysis_carterae.AAC.3